MKKFKSLICTSILALSLAGVVLVTNISNSTGVSAGSSKTYVVSSTSVVDGHINEGDLKTNGGVYAKASSIIFDETCDESSSILAKTKINNLSSSGVSELLSGSLSMDIKSMADTGSFSICFGLPSISSAITGKGTVEIRVQNIYGSLQISSYEHYGEGMSETLLAPKSVSALTFGKEFSISMSALSDRHFSFNINSAALVKNIPLNEEGSGFFGLFSNGKNDVVVTSLSAYGYTYSAPENVDYLEKFDNESYNANMFYSTSSASSVFSPSYLAVKDGALRFSNTGPAHFTTRYVYSNFDLDFDIPYIQRKATYDADGNITSLISNWFGVAWGVAETDQLAASTTVYNKWIQFEGMPVYNTDHTETYFNPRLVLWNKQSAAKIDSMSDNIFDPDYANDEAINMKITIKDGLFDLYYKLASQDDYGTAKMEYDFGDTTDGYVRIFTWCPSGVDDYGLAYSAVTNFSIDNFHITNTDSETVRQTISSIPYSSNGISSATDYTYSTTTDDSDLIGSRIQSLSSGNGNSWIIYVSVGAGVLLLASAAFVVIYIYRRINKHEEKK